MDYGFSVKSFVDFATFAADCFGTMISAAEISVSCEVFKRVMSRWLIYGGKFYFFLSLSQ